MEPLDEVGDRVARYRPMELEELLERAWETRRTHWRPVLFCSTPSPHRYLTAEHSNDPKAWAQFSVTGSVCALDCDHCGGRVLGLMEPAPAPDDLVEACRRRRHGGGLEGVLISGGSSADGSVPLGPYLEAMRELKAMDLQVVVHTGLVGREMAEGLARAGVDLAMTDVIGSREVARRVCHLDRPPEDWLDTLLALRDAGVRTAPHVVVGLDWGRVDSEYLALSMAVATGPSSLVVIVLSPVEGTEMGSARPPGSAEVVRLGAVARLAAPEVPLALGCVKPSGPQRPAIEEGMVDAGVNVLAYPLKGTLDHARSRGLEVRFDDRCCAMVGGDRVTGPP